MDIDQPLSYLPQDRQRDRAPVDAADVAPVQPHLAPQEQQAGIVPMQLLPRQHGIDRLAPLGPQPERRLDDSTISPRTHDGRIGPPAQHQLDGVDDDDLSAVGQRVEEIESGGGAVEEFNTGRQLHMLHRLHHPHAHALIAQ